MCMFATMKNQKKGSKRLMFVVDYKIGFVSPLLYTTTIKAESVRQAEKKFFKKRSDFDCEILDITRKGN
jgi:hypothetical protein